MHNHPSAGMVYEAVNAEYPNISRATVFRILAEAADEGKFELAKMAKQLNLDAIHDTVHEMARDEASHGKAFEGFLQRYFG